MMFRLTLAALLLFVQHVAVAHQLAHAFDHEPFHTQHSGAGGNFHSNLCVFHGDFASVLGAVKSTPPPLLLCGAAFERPVAPSHRFHTSDPVTPASRGPPRA
jgi:hypothetical protein